MDPVTLIVSAISTGAAAALKTTANEVVKDAYQSVKTLIQRKFSKIDLCPIEGHPESKDNRASLRKDLEAVKAGEDIELREHVARLVSAVEKFAPFAAASVGVDLANLTAASLTIADVSAPGAGVKVSDSHFTGDITITQVRAGKREDNDVNPR